MKLLMTIQPKDGSKPVDPVVVDTANCSLDALAAAYCSTGQNVLIFQQVLEYEPGFDAVRS